MTYISTPQDEPTVSRSKRSISATWFVGPADPMGGSRYARLAVHYIASTRRYEATLSRCSRPSITEYATTSVALPLHVGTLAHKVVILETGGSGRFRRRTLSAVFETALTTLRASFGYDVKAVTAYFDPATKEPLDVLAEAFIADAGWPALNALANLVDVSGLGCLPVVEQQNVANEAWELAQTIVWLQQERPRAQAVIAEALNDIGYGAEHEIHNEDVLTRLACVLANVGYAEFFNRFVYATGPDADQ